MIGRLQRYKTAHPDGAAIVIRLKGYAKGANAFLHDVDDTGIVFSTEDVTDIHTCAPWTSIELITIPA